MRIRVTSTFSMCPYRDTWVMSQNARAALKYMRGVGAEPSPPPRGAGRGPSPSRPITIVAPFPPGGIADLTARPLAAALERLVKQPVVVVNKPGAAGAVGNQSVAIAKPDGYTLLLGLVSISTLPEVDVLFGRTPVYSREQFVGIARLNADPPVLVANADQPWKTLPDLLEDA